MDDMTVSGVLPYVVVMVAVLIATVTDVRTLKIHNWLTFPLFLGGLIYHLIMGGPQGFMMSFLYAAFVFAVLLLPYVLGVLGAGDVKLVAAFATWLGTSMAFGMAAVGLFVTGIYSLVKLVRQQRLQDAWIHFKVSLYRTQAIVRGLGADVGGKTIKEVAASPEDELV